MTTYNNKTVLVVDDEEDLRDLLSMTLQQMQLQPVAVGSVAEAKKQLSTAQFDLCLTDMNLPDGNGIELVRHIQQHHSATPTAMITAYGSMDTATLAMKEGAFDFIAKPVSLARLRQVVADGLALQRTEQPLTHHELLGDSTAIQELRQSIVKVSRSQAPVFIHSSSGISGINIAQLIHETSPRAAQSFKHFSCAALPAEDLERALFGYYGKMNDATTYHAGIIAAANNGTLFLEDISELPLTVQLQLLQALQSRSLQPKGSQRQISFNVRFISSSREDLAAAVVANTFRQDLFFRLNVFTIKVPSLLERREDIPTLAQHYLQNIAQLYAMPITPLSKEALEALTIHPYTGDVQELENIIERALALCDGEEITLEHLGLNDQPAAAPLAANQLGHPVRQPEQPLEKYLEAIERQEILTALESTMWNRTAAAKRLGMSFRSLRYRLDKLAIDKPEED